MSILVTGSRGRLGSQIVQELQVSRLEVIAYSYSISLDSINWDDVHTVINCAATTPANEVTEKQYLDGNVLFLQRILPYLKGKNLVHFSTFSELYRDSIYQRTKMLGNSLLLTNSGIFNKLTILPLPTLDDAPLIDSICELASKGEMPFVDRLKYNAMTYQGVARYVRQLLVGETNAHITQQYQVKNLYEEVTAKVSKAKVRIGNDIDRTLLSNGIYVSSF